MHRQDRGEFIRMLNLIPQSEMERVFTKVAQKGCGVELNKDDVRLTNDNEVDPILRIYKTAKKCGCKFYLGSDAHHPSNFESTTPIFTRVIDLLGLTEDDKFHIGKK
jgi:histidinol phosphatase-like PHP family hydrolase